jgi:hypothetical protein
MEATWLGSGSRAFARDDGSKKTSTTSYSNIP